MFLCSDLENDISKLIEDMYSNCNRLDSYLFKEPPQRKQASKLLVWVCSCFFILKFILFVKGRDLGITCNSIFLWNFWHFFPVLFYESNIVLMTVFKFFWVFSRNHFLEEGFTFQWEEYPMGGIVRKKTLFKGGSKF